MTLYGHFPSRSELIAEVVDRAMQQTDDALEQLDLTGGAREALGRLLEASWHLTHRFGALVVAAQSALPHDQLREAHERPALRVKRLLRRGRKDGSFRTDMPLAWQVSTIQAVIHGASSAVHRGEITAERAPALVRTTVLAALTAVAERG